VSALPRPLADEECARIVRDLVRWYGYERVVRAVVTVTGERVEDRERDAARCERWMREMEKAEGVV
jgi:hypothetical protein